MTRLRRVLARRIYAVAGWISPPTRAKDDEDSIEWEISFSIWATEKVADEVFDRCSDALCGVDHHPLDPCPGPMFVGGLHPVDPSVTSNPVRGRLIRVLPAQTEQGEGEAS